LTILQISSVWESSAVDQWPEFSQCRLLLKPPGQNALKMEVLTPLEAQMGRLRSGDKNAARPIDLDIILFDRLILDPTLWHLAHRAVPVSEISRISTRNRARLSKRRAKFMSEGFIRLRSDIVLLTISSRIILAMRRFPTSWQNFTSRSTAIPDIRPGLFVLGALLAVRLGAPFPCLA